MATAAKAAHDLRIRTSASLFVSSRPSRVSPPLAFLCQEAAIRALQNLLACLSPAVVCLQQVLRLLKSPVRTRICKHEASPGCLEVSTTLAGSGGLLQAHHRNVTCVDLFPALSLKLLTIPRHSSMHSKQLLLAVPCASITALSSQLSHCVLWS